MASFRYGSGFPFPGFLRGTADGDYGVAEAADELGSALGHELSPGVAPVLERQTIVFVCHSTGGIVVRYLLSQGNAASRDKDVGMLLLASPSRGSNYARLIRSIVRLFDHRMGRELERESDSLREIDRQFRRMLEARSIPRLRGKEALREPHRLPVELRKQVSQRLTVKSRFSSGTVARLVLPRSPGIGLSVRDQMQSFPPSQLPRRSRRCPAGSVARPQIRARTRLSGAAAGRARSR